MRLFLLCIVLTQAVLDGDSSCEARVSDYSIDHLAIMQAPTIDGAALAGRIRRITDLTKLDKGLTSFVRQFSICGCLLDSRKTRIRERQRMAGLIYLPITYALVHSSVLLSRSPTSSFFNLRSMVDRNSSSPASCVSRTLISQVTAW